MEIVLESVKIFLTLKGERIMKMICQWKPSKKGTLRNGWLIDIISRTASHGHSCITYIVVDEDSKEIHELDYLDVCAYPDYTDHPS